LINYVCRIDQPFGECRLSKETPVTAPNSLKNLFLAATAIAATAAFTAPAAMAGVVNGSFEDPQNSPGGATGGSLPGWTGDTGTNYYFGNTTQGNTGLVPVNGTQLAFVNNFTNNAALTHGISQTLTDTLVGNTLYTLSAYFGWRSDNSKSVGKLQLFAGGTASGGGVVGGTLLASTNVALTQGNFVLGSVSFSVSSSDPLIGQAISIRLGGTPVADGFAQINFDQVTLTATAIPEPASTALLGAGLLGLGFARRRR
jgi:hypothetical protein